MTEAEARIVFDDAIAKLVNDPDKVARLELCREYFTNTAFRAALESYIWEANYAR